MKVKQPLLWGLATLLVTVGSNSADGLAQDASPREVSMGKASSIAGGYWAVPIAVTNPEGCGDWDVFGNLMFLLSDGSGSRPVGFVDKGWGDGRNPNEMKAWDSSGPVVLLEGNGLDPAGPFSPTHDGMIAGGVFLVPGAEPIDFVVDGTLAECGSKTEERTASVVAYEPVGPGTWGISISVSNPKENGDWEAFTSLAFPLTDGTIARPMMTTSDASGEVVGVPEAFSEAAIVKPGESKTLVYGIAVPDGVEPTGEVVIAPTGTIFAVDPVNWPGGANSVAEMLASLISSWGLIP